jgi:hypothetical protein
MHFTKLREEDETCGEITQENGKLLECIKSYGRVKNFLAGLFDVVEKCAISHFA